MALPYLFFTVKLLIKVKFSFNVEVSTITFLVIFQNTKYYLSERYYS